MFGGLHSPAELPAEDALVLLARRFTPRVQAFGATPVLMDLAGLSRAFASAEELGRAIAREAEQRALAAQVALAGTRVAALVLARARPGLTVVAPGQEAAALAPLPLACLDLDEGQALLLRRWGLRTLGELGALPSAGLFERLGAEGPRLLRLARGEDLAPLVPTPSPELFEVTLDLEWPIDGLEPLSFLLARLLAPLCEGLLGRGRKAAALTLELSLVDGTTHARELRPAAPSGEPRTWRTLALLELEAHPPKDAIRSLTLRALATPARIVQFSLLDPAQPSPEKLAETLARLHEWTKAGKGGAPRLLDTHRPGAFAVETFAPGEPRPRALVPPSPRLALRAFRPPKPATVRVSGGAPVFVSASGLSGTVAERAGPWRSSGDWWDVAWSREEWDVALAGGGLYRLYRDRLRDGWFVEGELD
jgi:protein ImuB